MSAFYYHVTLEHRVPSIVRYGVLTSKARGKRKVSWWVDDTMLAWAIGHVSHRHAAGTRRVRILAVRAAYMNVQNTRWKGVFTTKENVEALSENFETAYRVLKRIQENACWRDDDIPF